MRQGIVMEIKNRQAIVLTKDGAFERVALKKYQHVEIGSEIDVPAAKTKGFFNTNVQRIAISALAAAAIVLLVFTQFSTGIKQSNLAIAAYISLDINPSLEVGVNEKLNVVEVIPINADGEKIVSQIRDNYTNQPLSEFVDYTVVIAEKEGFLNENKDILLTATAVDQKVQLKIEENLDEIEKEFETNHVVVTTLKSDEKTRKEAKDLGVSTGKYILYKESKDILTIEETKDLSITQIYEKLGKKDNNNQKMNKIGNNNTEKSKGKKDNQQRKANNKNNKKEANDNKPREAENAKDKNKSKISKLEKDKKNGQLNKRIKETSSGEQSSKNNKTNKVNDSEKQWKNQQKVNNNEKKNETSAIGEKSIKFIWNNQENENGNKQEKKYDKQKGEESKQGQRNGNQEQKINKQDQNNNKQENRNNKQDQNNNKQENRNNKQEQNYNKQENRNNKQEQNNNKQENRNNKQEQNYNKQKNRNNKQEQNYNKQEKRNNKQD